MKLSAGKRTILLLLGFGFPALLLYVLSHAVLNQNMLAATKQNKEGEYGNLVNWLPQDAKLAIEYRARYLYLKAVAEKARTVDAKVEALFNFADYIKVKDAEASDRIMAELVDSPEYKNSRRAYKAYAYLLQRPDKNKRSVSLQEFYTYLNQLKWPEDRFEAWSAGLNGLYRRRPTPAQIIDFLSPLLDKIDYLGNYDRFYSEIERRAKVLEEEELEQKAKDIRAEIKKRRQYFTQDLLRAPLAYRVRYQELYDELSKAKKDSEKLSILTSIALHTRKCEPQESTDTFERILKTPEFAKEPHYYGTLAHVLLDRNPKLRISIADYHKVLAGLEEDMLKYDAWGVGRRRLLELKANSRTMVEYFKPLLEQPIAFSDYLEYFETLRQEAVKAKMEELEKRVADKIEEIKARKLKSFSDIDFSRE